MKILIIGTADRRSTIPQGVSYLCKNITVQSLEEITKYIFFMWLRPAVASFLSLAAFFSKKLDNIRFILYNQIEITKKVRWTK